MTYRLETSSPKVIPTTPTDKSNDRLEKPDAKTRKPRKNSRKSDQFLTNKINIALSESNNSQNIE
jgi:hypothetical protein